MIAEIFERDVELVAHLVAHDAADADAAGFGHRLEPRGNIDAVPVDVAVVDYDIADINTHAQVDATVGRGGGCALGHPALDFDRAAHRVDDARELDQYAVAGGLDDAAAVLGDLGVEKAGAQFLEIAQRALFVHAHQPAVAGDVSRHDGRQAAFDPFPAHLPRWSWQVVSSEEYDGTQPEASDGLVRPPSNGRLPPACRRSFRVERGSGVGRLC